ncbi:uncharacterized protein I303_104889 [Kwoniella dejecticola CBS 10117]|uniref:Proline dehydrogenase n=1 Tax=Kwoniella dejecticola CBS 10117 TaxID=1296121 RepID=A0A1A6A431_9TREE|nr:uncharacterized protein I303_04127 [Kwoniella dejecticola CBS 10117]OBR84806.1 hypothetical protein I303_04127 [Kwoniella dejecticola CBS 10117]
MIASHHAGSTAQAADLLVLNGLGDPIEGGKVKLRLGVGDRLAFAQICGMKDALTNNISSRFLLDNGLPAGIKLLPFGTLENSMPYLARRAVENKSFMAGADGATKERSRLGDELLRRLGVSRS